MTTSQIIYLNLSFAYVAEDMMVALLEFGYDTVGHRHNLIRIDSSATLSFPYYGKMAPPDLGIMLYLERERQMSPAIPITFIRKIRIF